MEEQMGAPGTQSQENAKVLTTREIQQKLEENAMLLEAINERQNMNSLKDCAEYQKKLESNLRELAALLETEIPSSPAVGQQPQ